MWKQAGTQPREVLSAGLARSPPPPASASLRYHDALGGDPHGLGDLPALVAVRVVVLLEYPFQFLQLV